MDMTELQGLLSQFQPTDADRKAAQMQGLLAMGLGMMGARRGQEGAAIGQSGLLGMQTQQNYLQNLLKQRQEGMQSGVSAMNLQQLLQAYNDDQKARAIAMGGVTDGSDPAMAVPVPGSKTPTLTGMPGTAPVAAPAAPMGAPTGGPPGAPPQGPAMAPAAPATPALPSKQNLFEMYSGLAKKMQDAGLLKQAQAYEQLAEKYRPQLDSVQKLTTPDGRRVVVNFYKDGTREILPDVAPDKEKLVQVDMGSKIGFADPFSGNIPQGAAMYTKDATPGEVLTAKNAAASNALGYANLAETKRAHNMQYGLDETGAPTGDLDAYAKMIANYEVPMSQTMMYRRPELGAQIMDKVHQINPAYDAKNFPVAQQTMSAFAKGKQGDTVRSIGVAMQHLDVLQEAGTALQNGDVQLFNKIGNAVQAQLGAPAPTNFKAVKDLVSNEIVKAVVGSGGGVGDRAKAQEDVSGASSPEQLSGVINKYKNLFAGQLSGLRRQYESNTMRNDFDKFLSPETKALLNSTTGQGPAVVDFNSLPKR